MSDCQHKFKPYFTGAMQTHEICSECLYMVTTADKIAALTAELERVKAERDDLDRRATEYAAMNDRQALRVAKAEGERDAARQACRLAMNAFEHNHAIDWSEVERNATK